MESKRFFVGNLPAGTTESDLDRLFNHYGPIERIELKTKENLVDPQNPKVLAFVTLKIDYNQVDDCVYDLANQRFKGQFLNVSVAKESFLERLKRERNDEGKQEEKPEEFNENFSKPINIALPRNLDVPIGNKSIKFDLEDNDEVPDLDNDAQIVYQSITKKKASSSLFNGKIKIQSTSAEPIHIINPKQKTLKRLDEKSQQADEKRKQSLKKMKNQYTNQKLAIQKALSGVDVNAKPNKIVFDHDVDADYFGAPKSDKKVALFDGDDDEDDEEDADFGIRSEFEGEEGRKLMKLQAKSLDPRFKMGAQFLEGEAQPEAAEEGEEDFDERKWQMNIIEQVMGKKMDSDFPNKRAGNNKMLRYDPTKEDHQQYLLKEKEAGQAGEKKPKEKKSKQHEPVDAGPEVSKEVFYTVSDDLTKSLKRRGEGFSLLSMFGRAEEDEEMEEDSPEYAEKILVNKGNFGGPETPFKFDSSDSEQEDNAEEVVKKADKKKGGKTKAKVWTENFFFAVSDPRLKEGLSFFQSATKEQPEDQPAEPYEQVKEKLRQIIRQKVRKNRKNVQTTKNRLKSKDFKKVI